MTGAAEHLSEAILGYVSRKEATEGPHGLFRYPAKYLPQIAGAVLDELVGPGDEVLDPFAGSGTTLVEAARFGNWSVAYHLYFFHLVAVWFVIMYLPFTKLGHVFYRTAALLYARSIGRK